jgi:hypothetical protein
MTRDHRKALTALKRANERGAPFTVAGDDSDKNFHSALVDLLADGVVKATRFDKKFYWSIAE